MSSVVPPFSATRFRWRFRILLLAVLAVFVGLGLFFTVVAQRSLEEERRDHARHMAESLKTGQLADLGRLVVDYAWWGDTIDNVLLAPDQTWIEENLTTWLHDSAGIDLVTVLDADETVRLLYPQDLSGGAEFLPQLRRFADQAEAVADGAVVAASGFLVLESRVYAGAAAVIARENEILVAGTPRPVLILAKQMDERWLEDLGERYLLEGLHLLPGEVEADEDSVLLQDVDGRPVGALAWDRPPATIDISRELTVPSLAILALLIGLLAVLAQRTDSLIGMAAATAEAQAAARRAAEDADALKSRLLSNVSHEIRTPLNAIIGFSALMRTEALGKLPPRYCEYLSAIHLGGSRLSRVVEDTLDFVQIEQGERRLVRAEMDVAALLAVAVRRSEGMAADCGVVLRVEEGGGPLLVDGDEAAVLRILSILIENAIAFGRPGEAIELRAMEDDATIVLEVADRGPGMPPHFEASTFEPFGVGLRPEQRTGEGAAVGLAVAGRLAALLGGDLQFRNREGGGMKAWLVLPRSLGAGSAMHPRA